MGLGSFGFNQRCDSSYLLDYRLKNSLVLATMQVDRDIKVGSVLVRAEWFFEQCIDDFLAQAIVVQGKPERAVMVRFTVRKIDAE